MRITSNLSFPNNSLILCISTLKWSIAALLILSCLNSGYSQAVQGVKEPNFQSPNASTLGKFGDMPISYHTGVPEISIPIYTIHEGNISVPIALSYHSSGVKVDDVASWVGLQWNLAAGGSITRTVIGGPDEGKSNTFMPNSNCGIKGWYRDYGVPSCLNLNASDCGSVNQGDGRGSGDETKCYAKYQAASFGTIDTEPDMYSFSFPGGSGKFFFNANRTPQMIPKTDYYIKPEEEPNLFKTWKIIAPDGTKYFFGGAGATEDTYSKAGYAFGPTEDDKASTTWYLTRIESLNGESWIQFEYESEQYSFGTKASHSYARGGGSGQQSGEYWFTSGMTLTNVDGKRLKRITTSSGYTEVNFIVSSSAREDLSAYQYGTDPNVQAKALEKIEIQCRDICKVFTLGTNYFLSDRTNPYGVTPETPYDAKRLKLETVQESTCDGSISVPSYEISYYDSAALPRRYSFNQDHWGYYNYVPNGQDNSTLLPPFIDPPTGQYRPGANREPNEEAMMAGILTKIKYPTGGFTEFYYEPHKETPSSTEIIGGLRIKQMIDNDGSGGSVVRNYRYIDGRHYAGTISYTQYPNQNQNVFPLNTFDFGVLYNSSPNPPLQATHGYHIGYSHVEVEMEGNGKSVYKYYNTNPIISNAYPKAPTIAVISTGDLLSEEHYDESNTLKKSVLYNYGSTSGNVTVSAKKVLMINCLNGSDVPALECQYAYPLYADYLITTYRNNLISKTESQDGVEVVTSYGYDNNDKHNFPKSVQMARSDGKISLAETAYPSDAGSGAPAIMYDQSVPGFKNLISPPMESLTKVNNTITSKVAYQFELDGSNVLLTSSKVYPTGGSDYQESQYEYDENSRLIGVLKNDGGKSSFYWGYKQSLPIAKVENAEMNQPEEIESTTLSMPTVNVPGLQLEYYTIQGNIIIGFNQNVTLNCTVSRGNADPSIPDYYFNVNLSFLNEDTQAVISGGSFGLTTNTSQVINLPAGKYALRYTYAGDIGVENTFYFNSSLNYQIKKIYNTIFHTSFEEDTENTNAVARTGRKSHVGTYSVLKPKVIGEYVLTYWTKAGTASWVFNEDVVNVTSTTPSSVTIGASGVLLDEVRLYPKGGLMSTYTYDPQVGITSMTDPNNLTTKYEYDDLGRLKQAKDHEGNILKKYEYHYQQEQPAQP